MTSTMTGSTDFPDLQALAFEVAEAGIGVLRINRPERMNAQTVQMFTEYGLAAGALRDSRLRSSSPGPASARSAPASTSTSST